MARPEKITLEVPTAAGVGKAENLFRFRDKTVQFGGIFVATLQLEGSLDGNEYAAIGTPVTAPGLVAVPVTVEFLRVRVVAFASGTPKATAAGFDFRAM